MMAVQESEEKGELGDDQEEVEENKTHEEMQ